jgi:hypothetical protein
MILILILSIQRTIGNQQQFIDVLSNTQFGIEEENSWNMPDQALTTKDCTALSCWSLAAAG